MYIHEVAEQLGTTSRTIRFYEEKGLIAPKKDKENDYRTFTEKDVFRLSTIMALREVGISLNDMKKLLEDPHMGMRQYLDIQRAALFEKWLEMKDMINTIDNMVEHLKDDNESIKGIQQLGLHLRNLKNIRQNWQDKWNFDSQAVDYDHSLKLHGYRFNVHQDYDQALTQVADTIQLKPGNTCLDIGIGTGNLGAKLLEKGINVIGVDQSEQMLKVCREKHAAIEVRKGHFLALPLLDQTMDGIVSSYALHHIPDDKKLMAFEEMTRVLKPGGQICIADLMFVDEQHREQVLQTYQQAGNTEAVYAIEDEYYANRSLLMDWLSSNGYHVETYRFNPILSMIYARKREVGS
ncbi:putative AdoMet-dependent methyltransferase [Virgibacillus halotolerans]|uniref:MerR family transcriptional regulator n=1 Tax=Virgibacillus halotolerans TaxID=1071053 RepID=UPI001961BBC7|nr:methyltransferase domain-containing protein [Virgibacillus halotolerans]MBM7600791.1 putative AdoMet-dependent methyltransferase [Virgibacillus halotolerans]